MRLQVSLNDRLDRTQPTTADRRQTLKTAGVAAILLHCSKHRKDHCSPDATLRKEKLSRNRTIAFSLAKSPDEDQIVQCDMGGTVRCCSVVRL